MISILEVQLHKYQGALPFLIELSSFPTELSSLSMELQFTASSHFFRTDGGSDGIWLLHTTKHTSAPASQLSPVSVYSLLSQCTLSCLSVLSLLSQCTLSCLSVISPVSVYSLRPVSVYSLLSQGTLSCLSVLSPVSVYSLLSQCNLSCLSVLSPTCLSVLSPVSGYSLLSQCTLSCLSVLSPVSVYSLLSQCTLSCLSGDRYIYLTLPCAGLFPAAWSCAFKCSISVEPLHVPTHMSHVLYFPNYLYTLEADANWKYDKYHCLYTLLNSVVYEMQADPQWCPSFLTC